MKTETLTNEQTQFLIWIQRNYEFLKHMRFEPPIQSYPHWLYEILLKGVYTTTRDRDIINYTIKYLRGMGLKTYNKDWTWDKNGAEMDWLCNVRVGIIKMPRGNSGTTTIGTI